MKKFLAAFVLAMGLTSAVSAYEVITELHPHPKTGLTHRANLYCEAYNRGHAVNISFYHCHMLGCREIDFDCSKDM